MHFQCFILTALKSVINHTHQPTSTILVTTSSHQQNKGKEESAQKFSQFARHLKSIYQQQKLIM